MSSRGPVYAKFRMQSGLTPITAWQSCEGGWRLPWRRIDYTSITYLFSLGMKRCRYPWRGAAWPAVRHRPAGSLAFFETTACIRFIEMYRVDLNQPCKIHFCTSICTLGRMWESFLGLATNRVWPLHDSTYRRCEASTCHSSGLIPFFLRS